VVCQKVHGSTAKLWSIVVVGSVAVFFDGRVVVMLSIVQVAAERTDPFGSVFNPADEGVDVCAAFLAPHDGVIFERDDWDFGFLSKTGEI